jgi:glutamine amidotransferase
MQRVAIVDYGSGNLHSAAKALERAARECELDARIEVTADPNAVAAADRIVLPGVGAFADCRRGLDAVLGLYAAIEAAVRGAGRPFLGICVGMQLMAERGLEFRTTPGFGWIAGDVQAITPRNPALKIPHMGWNTLRVLNEHPLLAGIPTGAAGIHAYFVHSFHLVARERQAVVAEADYGGPLTAIVAQGNVAGTQFHPEKSQTLGLRLLANFLRWRP